MCVFVLVTDLDLLKLLRGFQSQTHSLTQVSIRVLLRQSLYLKTHTQTCTHTHTHTHTHPHRGKYMVSQFNHIPVCLLCGSVCFVCSLCNNSTEKETMLNAETRLPSCVYKTNKPWSYLNRWVTRECECSSDQTTTATVVCPPVCSTLIVYGPSNKLLFCLSVGPSSI